jgi:hypothetical protein
MFRGAFIIAALDAGVPLCDVQLAASFIQIHALAFVAGA